MSMTGQHPGATMPGARDRAPAGRRRGRRQPQPDPHAARPAGRPRASSSPPRSAPRWTPRPRSSSTSPGAVLLDLDPASGGIEAIERIMGTRPTPVVVCGAMAAHAQAALAAGAVDVIGALDAQPGSPQYVTAVRRHLRVASRVRVITHPRNRLRAKGLTGHWRPPPSARRALRGARRCRAQRPRRRHRRVDRRPACARHDPRRPAGRPARPRPRRPAHGRRVRRGPGQLAGRPVPAARSSWPQDGRRLHAGHRARRPRRR